MIDYFETKSSLPGLVGTLSKWQFNKIVSSTGEIGSTLTTILVISP